VSTEFDVYVAYGRADSDWTRRLIERLEEAGVRAFLDEWDIMVGDSIVRRVSEAIVNSRSGIVVVGVEAPTRWTELEQSALLHKAMSDGWRLITVLLADVSLPPLLAALPQVDFRDVDGPAYERRFQELLLALRAVSNLPQAPPGPPIREREFGRLVSLFQESPTGKRCTGVIVGQNGSGKSALAIYVAHELRDHFPDGQLYASLAGRSDPAGVLGQFLEALGVRRADLPRGLRARIEAYRTATANKRLLVVLDDVRSMDQVRDLLPPRGGALLVARSRLTGLDQDSTVVELGSLSEQGALQLLAREAGADPVAAQQEAATAAVRVLGSSPLLLILLGRQMRERPTAELSELVSELVASGGPAFEEQIRAGLERAYRSLPAADQRLFRLIGVLLDPEFEVGLAAALVQGSADQIAGTIQRLVEQQLVEAGGDGRYRLRELARPLAERHLASEETTDEQRAALNRALRWLAIHGEYQPEPRIARDFWTTDDTLGYAQFADAIASFIRHQDTRPPLTIGIKAPWGAGKTSMMRMVQERLDPPEDRDSWLPTPLRLTPESRDSLLGPVAPSSTVESKAKAPVTILELFRRTKQRPRASDADLDALDVDPPKTRKLREPRQDWRPTVWFNPWMYQSGEQIWAGLAHEIISQVSGRMEAGDRERFWLELNLRRVDRQAVRRKIYRVLAERFLPLAVGFAVAVVVVIALLVLSWLLPVVRDALRVLSAVVVSAGTTGLLAEAVRRVKGFLKEEAAGQFKPLVGEPDLAAGSKKLVADEAKGAVDALIRDPGYEARLGFLYLVQTDMKLVLGLVATERRPLVVFVDDLDRCSPSTVAQVIEAINLFLAGEFPNCIFVLAVEPAVVAAHVEVAYKDLVDNLKQSQLSGQWSTLGWRFLEKIVQLPLSLPLPVDQTQVGEYVDSLLALSDSTPAVAPETPTEDSVHQAKDASDATVVSHGPAEPASSAPVPSAPTAAVDDELRVELVRAVEEAILRRQPTVKTLPAVARAAQDEVFGEDEGPLRPETLEAANRIFIELYSDADARDAIIDVIPALNSSNPREIKRFINLFRFYTFIVQQYRLRGEAAPTGPEIAKLAVLAIRWPHLLNMLGEKTDDGLSTVLGYLEKQARSDPEVEGRMV
jgi:hypothetical protein